MSLVRTVLIAALSASALATVACAPVVSRHGFQVIDSDPKDVKVGEDTKSTVLERLGSPSATSTFEPNVWYYVSQTSERLTYHQPQTTARDVTVVEFDEATETVTAVKRLTLEDGRQIAFNDRETPTRGRQLTILEQLLGNVGRQPLPNPEEDRGPGRRDRD